MSDHTKGPWVVNAHGYDSPYMCKAFIEDGNGEPVCGLWSGEGPDARLIAAAPDLLAALRRLAGPNPGSDDRDAAFDAIAKAEGK